MNFMDYNRDLYLKDFLEDLFEVFRESSIEYLILRNYKELPEHLRDGGDIDFILSEASFPRIHDVLSSIDGLDIIVSSKRTVVHEFIVRYNEKLFVKLDFHPFEDWHGAVYLKANELFAGSQTYKMFGVPSDFHQAITMLFASYLHGAFIKQKYISFVKPILAKDSSLNSLSPIIGERNVEMLRDFGKGKISDKQLLTIRRSIISHILFYNFQKEGFKFIKRFIATRIDEIRHRIKYQGMIISLETEDNNRAIESIKNFLKVFLGEDRIIIIDRNASVKERLKTWDDVGRLKFILYDNAKHSFSRYPDLVVKNTDDVILTITDFLVQRQNNIG